MSNIAESHAVHRDMPAAWIVGMALFPFGLVVGFTITALPFLLTHLGARLGRVAAMSATVMSPTFWGFLLQPLMDTGLTRRAYAWIMAASAALCVAAALFLLSPAHLGPATALLLPAELSIVLYSGAVGGDRAVYAGPAAGLRERLDQRRQSGRRLPHE